MPPSASSQYWQDKHNSIELASDLECNALLVVCDFNEDQPVPRANGNIKQIADMNGLTFVINEPTRITPTSSSLIDI